MLLSHVLPLKEEREEGEGGIKISSGSGTGDFEGLLRIEVGQEDSYLLSVYAPQIIKYNRENGKH